jgi:hypothetical protein
MKPTPPELLNFSYNVPEDDCIDEENVDDGEVKDATLHDASRHGVAKPVSCPYS